MEHWKEIMERIQNKKIPIKYFPLVLIAVGILAYGYYMGRLGFYWDEWPFLWFNHTFGQAGVIKYFNHNRPFWGYMYAITMPILGTSTLGWQVFGLVLRCLTGLSMWWALNLIWPSKRWISAGAALCFIVYPGFMEQSISLMYGHFYIVLTFFFLSVGLMALAIKTPGKYWIFTIMGMFCSAVNQFCMEYFFGMELLRPFFLWILLVGLFPSWKKRIFPVIRHYLPYLFVSLSYVYWRSFVFKFPTYKPSFLDTSQPLVSIWNLLVDLFVYIRVSVFDIYLKMVQFPKPDAFGQKATLIYWALVIASFVLVTLAFRFFQDNEEKQSRSWSGMILLSIPALLLAGIPFLLTGLTVSLRYPADRFILSYMLGGCLFFMGLVAVILLPRTIRALLIGLFISLSVGVQFVNATQFRQDWVIQKDFFWQLFWRAPAIEKGTLVMTEQAPHLFESDNSLTAPFNWTYAPDYTSGDMPYLFAFISVRTGTGVLKLEPDFPVHQNYKVVDFRGSTSQALVLYHNPPGCLRVLDPNLQEESFGLPQLVKEALPFSRPELILEEGQVGVQPLDFLGEEPDHGWCYYFEKADLARYRGDWDEVVELGKQAALAGFQPGDPTEQIIFIKGLALSGQLEEAQTLTMRTLKANPKLDGKLCTVWRKIGETANLDESGKNVLVEVNTQLGCQ